MRLDYFLQHLDAEITWNKLEWQWLNHVLVETAQRQAGGAQLSPSQLAAFVVDLGRVAFEAVKADRSRGPVLQSTWRNWPTVCPWPRRRAGRGWSHIAQTGLVRLSVSPDGLCKFASREEAEFLAAQYLIQSGADETLLEIARNGGRPFGVLTQAVRTLHFTGRDEDAAELIGALLKVSEDLPLRHADAAYLLAACEAPASPVLGPCGIRWKPSCASRGRRSARRLIGSMWPAPCMARTAANSRAMLRRPCAPKWCRASTTRRPCAAWRWSAGRQPWTAFSPWAKRSGWWPERHVEQGQLWDPLLAVLAAVPELAPLQQVAVLESLA